MPREPKTPSIAIELTLLEPKAFAPLPASKNWARSHYRSFLILKRLDLCRLSLLSDRNISDHCIGFCSAESYLVKQAQRAIDDGVADNSKPYETNGGTGNDILCGFSWGYKREIDVLTSGQGADGFMLGDVTGMFYLGGQNSRGCDASYAQISDWNPAYDYILAHGSASSYRLIKKQNWLGSSVKNTGIYMSNDLIGVVQDSTNVSFQDFVFV